MESEKNPDFVKYPRIPHIEESPDLLGREVYLFEKIDGSLSQVRRTETGLLAGSKANYITGSTKRPFWAPKFLRWMHSNNSLYNLRPGLIMFGEWLEPVTVEYDKDCLDKFYFIDLAILDEENNLRFYDYDEAVDYLCQWEIDGIEILPPIKKGFIDEEVIKSIVQYRRSALRVQESSLEHATIEAKLNKMLRESDITAEELEVNRTSLHQRLKKEVRAEEVKAEMEGVVLKNYSLQQLAKYLHPKYSEIREQEKTLEARYINQIRVNKAERRLRDTGNTNFSLDELVKEIARDINEESGIDFDAEAVKGILRIHDDIYHIQNH